MYNVLLNILVRKGGKVISHMKRPTGLRVYDKKKYRVSLVALWLRIRLPMQETRVRALVQEDPTCRGAAKPVCHNY